MDSARKIKPAGWMKDKAVKTVMAALTNGGEPQALFVGGCVRNTLLGLEAGDIDIACVHTPDVVTALLEEAGIKVVPTGIEHGTVTAVVDKRGFEITSLRRDVETDGRRAVVAFTDDWHEDAQRRDFTLNTLLLDLDGNIYDPTGRGLEDLEARRIVFVGDPAQRIAEDYLRILRFFRFHAAYGKGAPDAAALKACEAAADKIANLSKERITQEFFRIIATENPAEVLHLMFDYGVLKEFDFGSLDLLEKFCALQDQFTLASVPSRLFALADLKLENIQAMEKYLLFPKVFLKDMEALHKVLQKGVLDSDQKIKEAVYRHGRTATAQGLLMQGAQGHFDEKYLTKPLKTAIEWDVPDFPVGGEDMIRAGCKPGPELGDKLDQLENWWIEGGFKAGKDECLAQL